MTRLFPLRTYNADRPPRWCVWRWRPIHADNRPTPYILRLYLFMVQLFSMCIHWIHYPDPDADPHDHQRGFLSIVLRGSYVEEVYPRCPPAGEVHMLPVLRTVRWFNVKSSTDVHRIVQVEPGTITLVFNGKRRKDWNFYVLPDGKMPRVVRRLPVPRREYLNGVRARS